MIPARFSVPGMTALQTLADHEGLRREMGRFAAEHAKKFDLDENLDEILDLYRFAVERATYPDNGGMLRGRASARNDT